MWRKAKSRATLLALRMEQGRATGPDAAAKSAAKQLEFGCENTVGGSELVWYRSHLGKPDAIGSPNPLSPSVSSQDRGAQPFSG